MEFDFKKLSHREDDCKDKLFFLNKFKDLYQVEELIEENMWVAHDYNKSEELDGGCWMNFAFLEFRSQDFSMHSFNDFEVTLLMYGCGPTGSLKECRHTYWGKEGYIFYPNAKRIKTCLGWLDKYYEMS